MIEWHRDYKDPLRFLPVKHRHERRKRYVHRMLIRGRDSIYVRLFHVVLANGKAWA